MFTNVDMDNNSASLDLAFDVAQEFYLTASAARNIAKEVGEVVSGWRRDAELAGAGKREIDFMSSAFEHENLRKALQGG
jgi:serine/threonine-protein kinase HipA